MKKGIIIITIAILTIAFGIFELAWVGKVLTTMENSIINLNQQFELNEDNITIYYEKIGNIKEYWQEKEDFLCFLFNNRDLGVITDSINRLQAYTKNNDYDNAIAELAVLKEYSTENCHIMGFNLKNVF